MTRHRKTSAHNVHRSIALPSIAALAVTLGAMLVSGLACDATPLGNQAGASDAATNSAANPAADAAFASATAETVVRDIEEADIVKIVGDKLYALNAYKGLLIVDVTNPDAPTLLGQLDLRGRGVEMYVVGTQVCVLLSADWYYYVSGGGATGDFAWLASSGPLPPQPDFQGSQLAIIDASNPAAPALEGKLDLAGYADQSRRVGDIIYVVGTNYIPFESRPTDGSAPVDDGFVASVTIADPANIAPVERKTFSGSSLEIHVSASTIFASSQTYDPNAAEGFTHVQVIDISDPAGAIAIRGAFDAPGRIDNRFFMDDYQGVFRIVTQSWGFGFQTVKLFTFNLTDLDNVVALGQKEIIQGESARAVRFDGPRGYVVTYLQVDPLFVLDLRDPANPAVTGQLEVPGYSTYLEPRDTRLIAVGIDDTDGQRPALAYYNVEDPANPSQLSRVILGPPGSFTESEAVYDEKAFKVIDELGLIAIPFQHVDYSATSAASDSTSSSTVQPPTCKNAVQLVDFNDAGLTQRGWFEHKGRVQRVGVIGARVFALSQAALQTVDIADRNNPVKVGQVDFFTDDETPFWDDCAGWYPDGPVVMPSGFDWLFNWCGTVSALPGALLPCCLLLARLGVPGRRKQGARS
ncbi:MAG TPA: beta-propeller domain-containing protein [Phycisphaerae bacterium]|nr:beta-propeller domain-containing protein [Phycisphaerae bacterium]